MHWNASERLDMVTGFFLSRYYLLQLSQKQTTSNALRHHGGVVCCHTHVMVPQGQEPHCHVLCEKNTAAIFEVAARS